MGDQVQFLSGSLAVMEAVWAKSSRPWQRLQVGRPGGGAFLEAWSSFRTSVAMGQVRGRLSAVFVTLRSRSVSRFAPSSYPDSLQRRYGRQQSSTALRFLDSDGTIERAPSCHRFLDVSPFASGDTRTPRREPCRGNEMWRPEVSRIKIENGKSKVLRSVRVPPAAFASGAGRFHR